MFRCSPSTSILMRWNALLFVVRCSLKLKYAVTIFIYYLFTFLLLYCRWNKRDGKVFSRESRLQKSLQRNFPRSSGQLDSRNIFFYFGMETRFTFMGETISRNERLPHEFCPQVMNGGRWTKEKWDFGGKEQCGRNRGGGIVGIPWKMRIVEFARQQAVVFVDVSK